MSKKRYPQRKEIRDADSAAEPIPFDTASDEDTIDGLRPDTVEMAAADVPGLSHPEAAEIEATLISDVTAGQTGLPPFPSDDALAGTEPDSPELFVATAVEEPSSSVVAVDPEEIAARSARRRLLLAAVPGWLISLLVHVLAIVILASITLEPVQSMLSILEASTGPEETAIDEFDIQGPSLESVEEPADPLAAETPTVDPSMVLPEVSAPELTDFALESEPLDLDAVAEKVIPSSLLSASMLTSSTALNSRTGATKSEMLERYGGNADSEKAVAMALKWLADHQLPDGGWTFAHSIACRNQCKDAGELAQARNAATAMALLPFLGAGQTHLEGNYKRTVFRGLNFLINRMKVTPARPPRGSWHEPGGRMYSHGLAAITVCEAYAMTRDPDLLQPAQLSLNYLVYAQSDRDGGWRYEPKQPGDTSVVGWALMALKSGRMGNLAVPPSTFQGADRFLDFVSTNNGAYYGYNKPTAKLNGREATIAVGLLCRMYLGYPKEHPGLQEGVAYLAKKGPSMKNLYYSYYATQVMRHYGGDQWERWNKSMRDQLVEAQEKNGHVAGSWAPAGSHSQKGGRLYMTSLATMILEVYYRHMPLYSDKSADDEFEL
ncbi:MAG: hypothetical protein D6753_02135 [Planctomycetota bacterium]|nr:MAG: hypothetical protein D6753_02135 [Planctomycetota bacterium]